jgi:hypothetical protein
MGQFGDGEQPPGIVQFAETAPAALLGNRLSHRKQNLTLNRNYANVPPRRPTHRSNPDRPVLGVCGDRQMSVAGSRRMVA